MPRAEAVERERARVELGVGGGFQQFVCVVGENGFSGIERHDFHAQRGRAEMWLSHAITQGSLQRKQRFIRDCGRSLDGEP